MSRPRIATRLYALALRAFPRRHRDVYGAEMIGAFEQELASRACAHGSPSGAWFVLAALFDAARSGLGERRRGLSLRPAMSWLDVKLGFRMLARYPGLTVAAGLALALAIGLGAGWYDLMGDLFRPRLPLPEGDRIVEVEMRDAVASADERRILHDFLNWRRDLRSVEDLGAYRSLERNLIIGDARPEPMDVAEITASGFRLARVAPVRGRPLLDTDERPGAPPVVVIGYFVWQQRFGGRTEAIGQTVQVGRTKATVVGVMPEGFTFPVNHRLWMPLPLQPSGYAPLDGVPVRVFGRLAPGITQAQAKAEITGLAERMAVTSPRTHQHLRPRVLAYGGESPGDRSLLEFAILYLPIILVLLVACANVGTLVYARTATREAEIAMRYAIGATRGRIIGQLFIEALVLASVAAVVGLTAAHLALKWGMAAYTGESGVLPFWINPGLKVRTVLFSAGLTAAGAAILGILPAIKATGSSAQAQLKNLGSGGATLRFGAVWTTAMIGQVAITMICIVPAMGIAGEAWRDRVIRAKFPAEQYLAVRVEVDRATSASGEEEAASAFAGRVERTYRELQRRVSQEPEVRAVTFADRLPGMGPAVRGAEVEMPEGAGPLSIQNLWTASIGPGFFEAFDIPIVAGRDFHDGDRVKDSRTVLVNEAFARRYMDGASPVGRRVRYRSPDPAKPEPWLEIVGVARDIGMTPTDLGEAPYVFRAVSPATTYPVVMGIRTAGDPAALAPRVRTIAGTVDPGVRLTTVGSLEDLVWREDVPMMVAGGAIAGVVLLGLFLSAAGIFALMSVSIARRTREIGLRSALGATPARLLAGVFTRALVLIGSGIAAGNGLLLLFVIVYVTQVEPLELGGIVQALAITSSVMLAVGLLACVEPARRALRIQPTDALRNA